MQLSYANQPCEHIVQNSFKNLETTSKLSSLDEILDNLNCFSSHNLDSIFYFKLQDGYLNGNYYETKKYFERIYNKREKSQNIRILEVFCTYELGRYNEVLKLIYEYKSKHKNYFPIELLQAKIFHKKGEFQVSNNQLNCIKPRNLNDNIRLDIHIANNFIELEQFEKAEDTFNKILTSKNEITNSFYFNYANFKLRELKYQEALVYYQKYLDLNLRAKKQFSTLNHGRVYTNMMQCYGKLNNSSILSCKDSANYYKYSYLEQRINPEFGAIHQNLAEYYVLNKEYQKGMMHIDSAIIHHLHYLSDNPMDDLLNNRIERNVIHDKLGLLEYLFIKFKLICVTNKNEQVDQIFNTIDYLIQGIKKENYGVQSKLFSQDKLSKYYQTAFLYYVNRNELDLALQFSQKLKGTILLESINHSEATDFLIPEHRNQYLNLRYERNKLISELIDHQSKDSLTSLLSNNLSVQKELEESIQKQTPEFFNHLYINESFNSTQIRKALKINEVMLDYIVLQDSIYQLTITKEKLEVKKKVFQLKEQEELNSLKRYISQPPKINSWSFKDERTLKKRLAKMAEFLLFPIEDSRNQIIIIPHGILSDFPFCILTNSKNDYNYIIKSKSIYYTPNIALWLKNQQQASQLDKILIIDPYSKNNSSTEFLPSANFETKSISKSFKSKRVETTSIDELKQYSMVHFLSHTSIDNQSPWKSYLKQKNNSTNLSLENIKHSRLKNDLIFINSCESNVGLLSKNEGIISLTRAFLEAGSKSVIATFWPIDDNASSHISADFYMELKKSGNVINSLQSAQNTYLSKAGYYESHPFFWAAFHPNGINIRNDTFKSFKILIVLIFAATVGFFAVRRKLIRNS